MAELTTLEEKLAEVMGLAQAAQGATEKVEGMVEDDEIVARLTRMREEAEETERRCAELADARDGKKTAILEMAEAGEVGHRAVLGKLNESDVKDGSLRLAGEKDPYEES